MGISWSSWGFSSWLGTWFPKQAYKLTMVGLDNAGKTTALYKLSLGQTVATAPTIGSNVEKVQIGNLAFEIWDLGGQASQRSLWHLFFTGVDAVIVVVDSADRARIPIAKQELYQLLATRKLESVPLLILANKQDLEGAMGVVELTEALNLQNVNTHDWHMQPCTATTGEGLLEGLSWISQRVHRHMKGGA